LVSHSEMVETRHKFYRLAKQAYPNAGEPGTVWVLSEVLGWDWDQISRTAVEGFDKKGYRVFILQEDGKRTYSDDGVHVKTVYRKWTSEEKNKLRDWWWLLGF
jgi:hypothetical protein